MRDDWLWLRMVPRVTEYEMTMMMMKTCFRNEKVNWGGNKHTKEKKRTNTGEGVVVVGMQNLLGATQLLPLALYLFVFSPSKADFQRTTDKPCLVAAIAVNVRANRASSFLQLALPPRPVLP